MFGCSSPLSRGVLKRKGVWTSFFSLQCGTQLCGNDDENHRVSQSAYEVIKGESADGRIISR